MESANPVAILFAIFFLLFQYTSSILFKKIKLFKILLQSIMFFRKFREGALNF